MNSLTNPLYICAVTPTLTMTKTLARLSSLLLSLLLCFNSAMAIELGCEASAGLAFAGCGYSVKDDLFADRAKCLDSSAAPVEDCFAEAEITSLESHEECENIFDARLALCEEMGNAAHEPNFGPTYVDNFVDPMNIGDAVTPNSFFPLVQGNSWVYEGTFIEDGEEITETINVTVTNKTKLINGITCLVVRDVVTIDGELIEDTDDWFAQDIDGNIWYCGEEVKDYETFDGDVPANPELVSDDGSFKAGRDGDEAGLLLPAAPIIGDLFRQEMSVSNAEDAVEILALDASESSPSASCSNNCLQTRDFSPLDPDVEENKFYLPGVGLIVEVDVETGDRVELIDFTVN